MKTKVGGLLSRGFLSPEVLGNVISKRALANDTMSAGRSELTCPAMSFYTFEHYDVADNPYLSHTLKVRLVAFEVSRAVHPPDDLFYLLLVFLRYYHE